MKNKAAGAIRNRHDAIALCGLLCFYAAISLALSAKLPLWLDELIDLHLVRDFSLREQLIRIPINAGGVPLSYLIRDIAGYLLGYTTLSGRLPSLLFSLIALAGAFVLGRQMKLRFPLLAVLLLCTMPIQFRYGLESRPYSLVLAITVWASVALWAQVKRASVALSFCYGALALAGLYAQPFAIFVFAAHLSWICFAPDVPNRRKLCILVIGPIGLALACFLPWELSVVSLWRRTAGAHETYQLNLQTASVLFRELTGAGYIGSAVLLGLASVGLQGVQSKAQKVFWILYLVIPVVLALVTDTVFGYFFASRQVIPIIAPLALLAAAAIERLWQKRGLAISASCAAIAVFAISTVGYCRKPREDWQAAALLLRSRVGSGECTLVPSVSDYQLYGYFVPDLRQFACSDSRPLPSSILFVVNPYKLNEAAVEMERLRKEGYTERATWNPQRPRVIQFVRATSGRSLP